MKKKNEKYTFYTQTAYVYWYIILENNYKPDNIYLFLLEIFLDTYSVLVSASIYQITRYLKQNCHVQQHVKHKLLKRHIFTYDKQYKGFFYSYMMVNINGMTIGRDWFWIGFLQLKKTSGNGGVDQWLGLLVKKMAQRINKFDL